MLPDLEIKGYRQSSLIEWPGLIVDSIFLAGCDFRCPFCHNPDLIAVDTVESYNTNDVLEEIARRAKSGWLDGISITGGEPALSKKLPEFLEILKKMGLKTKIDTNGNHPQTIEKLIEHKLIDYIAMDVKAIPKNYHLAVGKKINLKPILQTIEIILNADIDHEFRTTVVPTIVNPEKDLLEIAEMIKGAKRFYIQQFRPLRCLNKEFEKLQPLSLTILEEVCEKLKPKFTVCEVR
ncbi:MAG: anaerobic ribonucleoside-triphosphate reductase activating protein [Candidatus Heimdallarchaeota archaeon]|nr:anaerobic ribonucleoside-triphosphate reductase activating protein [Candidatus Heimdallarchaeota archaeon]